MHEKVVVIDDHTVMLGSQNVLSQRRTREVMITMRGQHWARKLLNRLHAEEFSQPPPCAACHGTFRLIYVAAVLRGHGCGTATASRVPSMARAGIEVGLLR